MRESLLHRGVRIVALAALAVLLPACSSAPTRVTLMPDHDGHVGAVVVGDGHGNQQRIDRAYGSVEVEGGAPTPVQAGAREAFEQSHRDLIAAQPTPPRSFVLHFKFDSMELTPESERMLPDVLAAVRDRLPTEVTVFGYTDAVGTHEYNLDLSAQRARAVAAILRRIDPKLPVQIEYFGEKSPAVRSPPGVPEPRNRRAEIFVL